MLAWLKRLVLWVRAKILRLLAAPPAIEPRHQGERRPTAEKIDAQVRRFTLALEQCTKGPERRAELKANLDYWLAVKRADELRPN